MHVSFIDVTPLDDGGGVRITPIYFFHTPPPASIPSMGDWKGNVHGACPDPIGSCSDEETAGHKIAELLVHRYYYDIYNNQGLHQSYAHFHTGIYSAGEGTTFALECPSRSFAVDFQIGDNYRADWELFGCFGPGALLQPTSSSYCVTEFYIEAYADILETRAVTYNPGGNRKLFSFFMGSDYLLNGSDNTGHHFPAAFMFGNFVYAQPSHSIYGF